MNNKTKNPKFICAVIGLVALLVPFAFTILYTVPAKDDFIMAMGMENGNLFLNSLVRANDYYLHWQGIWYFSFLEVFLNPLLLFDSSASFGIGIEMLIFFGLLVISMASLVAEFAKNYAGIKTKEGILGLFILVLFAILNTGIYSEVFYWFVGAEYMWGATLTVLTMMLELKYFKNQSLRLAILLSVVGFLSSITYYMCITPCAMFLTFIIVDRIRNKKFSVKNYIPFIFLILGAALAAFAPGNFNRADTTSTSAAGSIVPAIYNTTFIFLSQLLKLLMNPLFVGCIIVFIMIGYFVFKKVDYTIKNPLWYLIAVAAIVWGTIFPQALGYGDHSITNRYIFVINFYLTLLLVPGMMWLGGFFAQKKMFSIKKKNIAGIAFIMTLFMYLASVCMVGEDSPYVYTLANMREVRNRGVQWKEMYARIEAADEAVVIIDDVDYFKAPIIKDPTVEADWVKNGMKAWYNKEDIIWTNWQ